MTLCGIYQNRLAHEYFDLVVSSVLALAFHPLSPRNLTFAGGLDLGVVAPDFTAARVVADKDAGGRNARTDQLERMRCRAVCEQLLAATEDDRRRKNAKLVVQIVGEQCMHDFGAALGDEIRAGGLSRGLKVPALSVDKRAPSLTQAAKMTRS